MRKKETHGDSYQVPDDLTLAEAADMLNRKLGPVHTKSTILG
jgi:hypothetical protein